MPQRTCECEAGWARCREGLQLLQRKNEYEQGWHDSWKNDDWWAERSAWQKYAQAVRRLAWHLRAKEIESGSYLVWVDYGDDGYTSHDWHLMGRADSIEGLNKVYQQALGNWRTAEIVVAKELEVEVVQALQIRVVEEE